MYSAAVDLLPFAPTRFEVGAHRLELGVVEELVGEQRRENAVRQRRCAPEELVREAELDVGADPGEPRQRELEVGFHVPVRDDDVDGVVERRPLGTGADALDEDLEELLGSIGVVDAQHENRRPGSKRVFRVTVLLWDLS